MAQNEKNKKIYMVFDETDNYWLQFDSLLDAASEAGTREVYIATPKLLGKFKVITKPVKIKNKKKRVKK